MIGPFENEFRFLSNFYDGYNVCYRGYAYKTAEHAFQAAKAKSTIDRDYVALALTPAEAKKRGRHVELRPDWEFAKDRIMYEIVKEKFLQHGELARKLMATGDEELVEVNTWGDRYWGQDPLGKGQNKLGKILMRVRNELNESKHNHKI
jgi:ribA/ribD-fused uncharacterized protein